MYYFRCAALVAAIATLAGCSQTHHHHYGGKTAAHQQPTYVPPSTAPKYSARPWGNTQPVHYHPERGGLEALAAEGRKIQKLDFCGTGVTERDGSFSADARLSRSGYLTTSGQVRANGDC